MRKLCRVDIGKCEEIDREIAEFAKELRSKFGCDVYLYDSFAKGKGEIHEGSDIDLIIVICCLNTARSIMLIWA
jgi:predicted nucleotidyltransferase